MTHLPRSARVGLTVLLSALPVKPAGQGRRQTNKSPVIGLGWIGR
jgi:hypothetical protein